MRDTGGVESGLDLCLALAASCYHPDETFRAHLRRAYPPLAAALAREPLTTEVQRRLAATRGTVLEPFSLTDDQRGLSIAAAGLAFAGEARLPLRVVSGETIGTAGGLILEPDLSETWISQMAAEDESDPESTFVAPAALEDFLRTWAEPGPSSVPRLSVQASTESRGVELVTDLRELADALRCGESGLTTSLRKHSSLGSERTQVTTAGLRIECRGASICISTGSPESLLRFTSHMASASWLTLSTADCDEHDRSIVIPLELPDADQFELAGWPHVQRQHVATWTDLFRLSGPALADVDRVRVAGWLGVPTPWLMSGSLGGLR